MPLIHKKSKAAFQHNMKAEMEAGKPQNQALAISYDVKRRAKRKMAAGGKVNEVASTEHRPSPQELDKDKHIAAQNSHSRPNPQDRMTDQPDRRQSMRGPKTSPIKHPRMVATSAFTARLRDEEDDLQHSAAPRMANGGTVSFEEAEQDKDQHPANLETDNDELSPAEDEIMSNHMDMLAEGGMTDEDEMEHASSIAAAIMAKRARLAEGGILSADDLDTTDDDQADLAHNAEESANMEDIANHDALLKENYSESEGLDALDSPKDSNEHSPKHDSEDIDDADLVSAIRRKMKIRSAMTE